VSYSSIHNALAAAHTAFRQAAVKKQFLHYLAANHQIKNGITDDQTLEKMKAVQPIGCLFKYAHSCRYHLKKTTAGLFLKLYKQQNVALKGLI